MSKSFRQDLTGKRFGRLTVLEFVPNDKPHSYWKCQCDCGNITAIKGKNLKSGNSASCGCLRSQMISRRMARHGFRTTRIYRIHADMKARCYNKKHRQYDDYGGRGIKICSEWNNDFQSFYDWAMANGYDDTLTIDRIDVNGNYEPSNCRWVDIYVQANNKRTTKKNPGRGRIRLNLI